MFNCFAIFVEQSHNLRCTESFMRENVEGELGQLGPDDETKQKMLDILKRFHSEEEADAMDDDEAGMAYYLCLLVFLFFFEIYGFQLQ